MTKRANYCGGGFEPINRVAAPDRRLPNQLPDNRRGSFEKPKLAVVSASRNATIASWVSGGASGKSGTNTPHATNPFICSANIPTCHFASAKILANWIERYSASVSPAGCLMVTFIGFIARAVFRFSASALSILRHAICALRRSCSKRASGRIVFKSGCLLLCYGDFGVCFGGISLCCLTGGICFGYRLSGCLGFG